MRKLFQFLSIFIFAARRLWHNLGLIIGTGIGLLAAVALVISVPLYADGVNYRLMSRALAEQEKGSQRPPYAFMYRYIGSWHGAVDWPSFQAADRCFDQECVAAIGLPVLSHTRYVKTDNLLMFPSTLSGYTDTKQALDRVAVGFVTGIMEHIRITEGRFPSLLAADGDAPLEVMIHEAKANELGLATGEEFIMLGDMTRQGTRPMEQIRVRLTGIWLPRSVEDPFWFYRPDAFDAVLLTHERAFEAKVVPAGKAPVYLALWYTVFDGRNVYTEDVPDLMGRIVYASTLADRSLPKTSLDISPLPALHNYVEATRLLTVLLFVFAIPVLGLVLYFVMLTTNLVVQRQRNEIAVLRSRGTSVLQILVIYLLEGLILGAAAMAVGPVLGQLTATLMGSVRSFLSFSLTTLPLTMRISQQSLQLGAAAVVIALLSSMIPAVGAARHTIVTYKQDIARSLERPWWQKLYLDVLLLAVPLYGYYLLQQRGTLSFLGRSVTASEGDPFRNPLLFLVPTLFVVALALLFIRVFPILMALLARLFEALPPAAPLLALRQLSRSWSYYTGPLLLIVLTMGLACFTASMARTLDAALTDQTYYDIGADLRLVETGEATGQEELGFATAGSTGQAAPGAPPRSPTPVLWYFLPVSEHDRVPGVVASARISRFPMRVRLGQSEVVGTFVGIDRLDYLKAAYFRRDFADASLGLLINQLAMEDRAVLVTRSFLGTFGLGVGDAFTGEVRRYLQSYSVTFIVAGVVDLFPTIYPSDGVVFVGNLEYLHEQMGGTYPYDVLLRVEPGSDTRRIVDDVQALGLRVLTVHDSQKAINQERERPERQGILGLLTVGAMAASLLTVLGLLFYAFVSFRRRFIELGILRALGLSTQQMLLALGMEQFTLITSGVLAGTGFGVWASSLFIPFLQVREGANAQIPPFVVQIAWSDMLKVYAVFGAMLLVTVIGLVWLLARMRIAEAVKLGESV